ncbi:MAG: hypothetical protein HC859_08280, partial [Bacteroidia bacterium]|nr:hypothetical protein [Bacteroidia bacterium]
AIHHGVALAKVAGRATMRLANAAVLPFQFNDFFKTAKGYLTEVIALADNMRETTEVENDMVAEKRYIYAADPTEKYIPPTGKDPVPYFDFSSLQNAMARLEKACETFGELQQANPKPNTNIDRLNALLFQAEQKLLNPEGLPRVRGTGTRSMRQGSTLAMA